MFSFNFLAYIFEIIMCLLLKIIKLTEIEKICLECKDIWFKKRKNTLMHIFHTYVFDGPLSAM